MAFGDIYGYKTNGGFVPAVAESDVYDTDKVDLNLIGYANGRRKGVTVVDGDESGFELGDVANNEAVEAEYVVQGKRDGSNPVGVGM